MTTPSAYREKRVVVSGCSSGIGRATAKLLVEEGAQVYGLDLKPNDLNMNFFKAIGLRGTTPAGDPLVRHRQMRVLGPSLRQRSEWSRHRRANAKLDDAPCAERLAPPNVIATTLLTC